MLNGAEIMVVFLGINPKTFLWIRAYIKQQNVCSSNEHIKSDLGSFNTTHVGNGAVLMCAQGYTKAYR